MCDKLRLFELFLLALHAPNPPEEIDCTVNSNSDVDISFVGIVGEIFGLCLLKEG